MPLASTPLFALALAAGAPPPTEAQQEIVVAGALPSKCAELPGADVVIDQARRLGKRFVIFGEWPGTTETPELFGDFVCHAARQGAINIILEFPIGEQPALDAFVAAPTADRHALTDQHDWTSTLRDGRTSTAMFALMVRLKALARFHPDLKLFYGQPAALAALNSDAYYNLDMGFTWAKIAEARPDALNIVLVGQGHVARHPGGVSDFMPAAEHLPPRDVIALRAEPSGGSAWTCSYPSLQCGPHALEGHAFKPRFVGLFGSRSGGVDGTYSVGGPFSASPPYPTTEGRR